MSVINKVVVSSRLESGDDIDVSVKAVDRPLSKEDKAKLDANISQKIIPFIDDVLYFRVRLQSGVSGKDKDNWNKLKSITELNEVINNIFEGV